MKELQLKIAGVTFDNPNGESRQDLLARCKSGEELRLIADKGPKDSTAVKVCRQDGSQLGYIPKENSPYISKLLKAGEELKCTIKKIRGGGEYNYGAEIAIFNPNLTQTSELSFHDEITFDNNILSRITYKLVTGPRIELSNWFSIEDDLLDLDEDIVDLDAQCSIVWELAEKLITGISLGEYYSYKGRDKKIKFQSDYIKSMVLEVSDELEIEVKKIKLTPTIDKREEEEFELFINDVAEDLTRTLSEYMRCYLKGEFSHCHKIEFFGNFLSQVELSFHEFPTVLIEDIEYSTEESPYFNLKFYQENIKDHLDALLVALSKDKEGQALYVQDYTRSEYGDTIVQVDAELGEDISLSLFTEELSHPNFCADDIYSYLEVFNKFLDKFDKVIEMIKERNIDAYKAQKAVYLTPMEIGRVFIDAFFKGPQKEKTFSPYGDDMDYCGECGGSGIFDEDYYDDNGSNACPYCAGRGTWKKSA